MKDFAGNELEVGMKVICLTAGRSTSWMVWSEVVGFTPQKVRVKITSTSMIINHSTGQTKLHTSEEVTLRDPQNVVVPMTEDLADHLRSEYQRTDFPDPNFPTWD